MKNRKILDKLLELNETINFIDSQYVKIKKMYDNLRELGIKVDNLQDSFLQSVIQFDRSKSENREFLKREIEKLKKNML